MPVIFECVMSISPPATLTLLGATLPAAYMGEAYSANILGQASGGIAPLTFSQLADVGNGTFATSSAGLITGTASPANVRVDSISNYRVDNLGNVRVTA